MDYFNDYASFYPTSSAREEPNTFQPSDQTSATGWTDNQPYNTFTDLWGMPEQSGSVVGEPTNLLATTSYGEHRCNLFADWCLTLESPESLAPATSYVNQADGYSQPSYSSNYWPEVGQEAQSYYSGSLGQEFFFENTAASEPSIVIPAPGSGKSLSSSKLRTLEYLPITNSPVQLLGGKPERSIHKHVPHGKRWSSFILA